MQPPLKQDHTMNTPISLEPGVYVNIFPVTIPEESVHFMVASRGSFPDLRSLRKRIQDEDWNTQVYAHGNKVYGYGAEMEYLLHEGFEEEILYLSDFPQLTARLIEEGILRLLSTEGYEARVGKGRLLIFHANRSTLAANGKIKVYQGMTLGPLFGGINSQESLLMGWSSM